MAHRLHIVALLCMAGLGSRVAHADDLQVPLALKQVDIEEHLGEKLPLDLPFVDQTGKTVQLGDLFHGKPVVLSLVYFKCPMLCSLVLAGQAKVMREMDLGLGKDYSAVTVSFDPHDTPRDAEVKQHNYLQSLGKPDEKTSWTFLTGQPDSIGALTRAIGFKYYYDEGTQQFAHAAAIFIITPEGKISRYLYQLSFEPKQLKLAVVEAAAGRAGTSVLDRGLLSCYRYDIAEKRYKFYVMGFIKGGALLGFVLLAGLLGRLWYLEAKHKFATNGKWTS
jgi:protein SCO1/2